MVFSRMESCFGGKVLEVRRAERRRMSSRSSAGRGGFGGAADLDFEVVVEGGDTSRVLRADLMSCDFASRI